MPPRPPQVAENPDRESFLTVRPEIHFGLIFGCKPAIARAREGTSPRQEPAGSGWFISVLSRSANFGTDTQRSGLTSCVRIVTVGTPRPNGSPCQVRTFLNDAAGSVKLL